MGNACSEHQLLRIARISRFTYAHTRYPVIPELRAMRSGLPSGGWL
jgi:hypothetical protein